MKDPSFAPELAPRQQTQIVAKIETKQFFRGVNSSTGNEQPRLGTTAQVQQSRLRRHAMLGSVSVYPFPVCARVSTRRDHVHVMNFFPTAGRTRSRAS